MNTNAIDNAFEQARRSDFVLENEQAYAALDLPLPIGFGQTNSNPVIVRNMLKWLEVEPGNKILDVGSGSGWTTALLALLVGPKGKIFAVERIPELVEFGKRNYMKLGLHNAMFYQAEKEYGLPRFAPFDRILVSAAADKLPKSLVSQLKVGGKMVIPVRFEILEIIKLSDTKLDITTNPGYIFVPLISGEVE